MTLASLRQAAGVAPAEQQEDPTRRLFRILDTKREEIGRLLPKSILADQFIGVAKTAVLNTPDLALADQRTFFTACMSAAAQGLMPDGKEAVLNAYNTKIKVDGRDQWIKKVQFLPMVQGLVKKLYQSKQVTYVDAAAVYERDQFNYERGDNNSLTHKPSLDDDPGKIIAAYAVVKLANGEIKREVMPRRDIEKVRAASKAPDGPGWSTWYDQFAIKSVLKRAYKQLPSVPEFESLMKADNEAIGFVQAAAGDLGFIPSSPAHAAVPAIADDPSQTLQPQFSAPAKVAHADNATAVIQTQEAAKESVAVAQQAERPEERAHAPSVEGSGSGAGSNPAGDGKQPDSEAIAQLAADWTAAIDSASDIPELEDIAARVETSLRGASADIKDRIAAAIDGRRKALTPKAATKK